MRPTVLASAVLALLLSSLCHAADTPAPTDAPAGERCHAEHHEASAPAAGHCAKHSQHDADEHGRLMPPPLHEPPLAAVKACVGKKAGSKTTIYFNGDSIAAVCQHYDGMILAKPLQALRPPAAPIHQEDASH